jgi:hypothetical protein
MADNEQRCPAKMQSFSEKKTGFWQAPHFIFGRSYFFRALDVLSKIQDSKETSILNMFFRLFFQPNF